MTDPLLHGRPELLQGGHRVRIRWCGQTVTTLADLIPLEPLAICVGINPTVESVEAGHYYQGRLGQRFLARLRTVGLLDDGVGWEDDAAVAAGIGFTDIVKRPTRRAKEVQHDELECGKAILIRNLADVQPALVVFAFKKVADALLGPVSGNGLLSGHPIGDSRVFVMPGPMEANVTAQATLRRLGRVVRGVKKERRLPTT